MNETNPGGSLVPTSPDLTAALREYRRLGSHWRRYVEAARRGRGRRVLDLGCGHGLGAAVLGAVPREYVGIEIDAAALAWARAQVAPRVPRTRFLSPAEAERDLTPASFDLVLCFEVLEHVAQPEALIQAALAWRSAAGSVLFSTPNGAVSHGDARRFRSPFHLREYAIGELVPLVEHRGLSVRYFAERRRDRLDAIALRAGCAAVGPRTEGGLRTRMFDWFQAHWDGPMFWTIVPMRPEKMGGPGYSTILVELGSPEPGGPITGSGAAVAPPGGRG